MGGGKYTKPGGHYVEIKNLQRGIKNALKGVMKCSDCDDDNEPPKYPRWADRLANRPVKNPFAQDLPWWAEGGITTDIAIQWTGYTSLTAGGGILLGVAVTSAPILLPLISKPTLLIPMAVSI